jgi:3-oxoacyl-[acyl-carrier-protein] synthase-3
MKAAGHYHPENVIDNSFFDGLDIGSDAEWIADRTGIKSRRSVLTAADIAALHSGEKTLASLRAEGRVMTIGEMGRRAYDKLKERLAKEAADDKKVDAVICGTSVPDYDIPANACSIAAALGFEQAVSFDVNSACSAFVMDMIAAKGLIQSGTYQKIAVFNPERYTLRLDYRDRRNCILFGDGCSAALLEGVSEGEPASGLELMDVVMISEPAKYEVVKMPDGDYFDQDGNAVQKFAITQTLRTTQMILDRNQLAVNDLSYFISHQANLRMIQSAVSRLGLAEEKHLYNVDEFGNQGAAGAPAVLSMNWDRFKPGDLIVLTVVGSGLTWGSALFKKW